MTKTRMKGMEREWTTWVLLNSDIQELVCRFSGLAPMILCTTTSFAGQDNLASMLEGGNRHFAGGIIA